MRDPPATVLLEPFFGLRDQPCFFLGFRLVRFRGIAARSSKGARVSGEKSLQACDLSVSHPIDLFVNFPANFRHFAFARVLRCRPASSRFPNLGLSWAPTHARGK